MAKTPRPAAAKPGTALRRLRLEHNWTLAEVSRRTRPPISTLSKVENNKLSLSYDKLVAHFGQGLDIDIAAAVRLRRRRPSDAAAPGRRHRSPRAGEGRRIDTDNYRRLYPAADLLDKRFNPILAERASDLDSEQFGELMRHPARSSRW